MIRLIELSNEQSSCFSLLIYKKEALNLLLQSIMKKQEESYDLEPINLKIVLEEYALVIQQIDEQIHKVLESYYTKEERAWLFLHAAVEISTADDMIVIEIKD